MNNCMSETSNTYQKRRDIKDRRTNFRRGDAERCLSHQVDLKHGMKPLGAAYNICPFTNTE